jgi:hypothetical protein
VPAGLVVAAPTDDLLLDDLDPSPEPTQALHDRQQALMQRCWDAPVCRVGEDGDELIDVSRTLGDHDAKLGHQPAQRVDQHGALLDQDLANPRLRGVRLVWGFSCQADFCLAPQSRP